MKSLKGLCIGKLKIARVVLKDRIVEFEMYNVRKELRFDVWVCSLIDDSQGICSSFPSFEEAVDYYNEQIGE